MIDYLAAAMEQNEEEQDEDMTLLDGFPSSVLIKKQIKTGNPPVEEKLGVNPDEPSGRDVQSKPNPVGSEMLWRTVEQRTYPEDPSGQSVETQPNVDWQTTLKKADTYHTQHMSRQMRVVQAVTTAERATGSGTDDKVSNFRSVLPSVSSPRFLEQTRTAGELPLLSALRRAEAGSDFARRERRNLSVTLPETPALAGSFSAEAFDRTVERDARRYDGGFSLY